jgi:hypothetical protein
MAKVEGHLVNYLATEKIQTLREGIARKTVDAMLQAVAEVELHKKALLMPIEELERKSSKFDHSLKLLEAKRVSISDLLAGDRRRFGEDLEAKATKLRVDASSQLVAVIDSLATKDTYVWEELRTAVAAKIEKHFTLAREQYVDFFSKHAGVLLQDHRRQIDDLVQEVRATAAAMFDVAFPAGSDPEEFKLHQEPYWVTKPITSSLIPDVGGLIDDFFPGGIRRRRLRRRIIAETNELIVRNVENLRWAILRGLDETYRAALRQMEERLWAAVAGTRDVIREALARRRDSSFAAKEEIGRLEQAEKELRAVLDRF